MNQPVPPPRYLSLNDHNAWRALTHAYGTAENIPVLLRAARATPRPTSHQNEPWFTLWSALCHQDTIYPASIAAVPHLLEMAETSAADERPEALQLFTAIIVAEQHAGLPRVAQPIADAYRLALARAPQLLLLALREARQELVALSWLAGLAAISGQTKLAYKLFHADEQVECPNCDAVFSRYYDLSEAYSYADEQSRRQP